jgi:short-subunit dehydrogenase
MSAPRRRHCVITGAADGIGKALAQAFAAADYTITGIDLDIERAQQVERELQQEDSTSCMLLADLSNAADLQRLLGELAQRPPIDVLIHNAGISAVGPFAQVSIDRQIAVLEVNLLAPLVLTAALFQQGRLAPQSSLAFVSSLSHFVSYPGAAVYAASKDGIASFARSLRVALAGAGHSVLTIYPGPTRTAHARRYSPDNRNEQRRMAPEQLAQQILRAVQRRQASLIPGLGNQTFALVGQWLPSVTGQLMRRMIFVKLRKGTQA